jgi:outer membrane protein insertion porin family
MKKILFLFLLSSISIISNCQIIISENEPYDFSATREFEIGGITVSGTKNFDTQTILLFSGLTIGDKINVPGDKISGAIKNLWEQKLFSDVKINAAEIRGNVIFLNIELTERARLSRFSFDGVSKSEADNLREKIELIRGTIVNENLINTTSNTIRNYFVEKGYLRTTVSVIQNPDTILENSVSLKIKVDKGRKVKIKEIYFDGISAFSEKKLQRSMKKTKEKHVYRLFATSKFINSEYRKDKNFILDKYNEKGYRNAKILVDSVYKNDDKTVNIFIKMVEGKQFYFGDINFVGNTKYSSDKLSGILNIEKGEIFDAKKFESRLLMNQNGGDVSSLYLDDGYLAFQAVPVETSVENDTINMEIRIYEGKQYRINEVIINGNTATNEHVVRREIRTKPGDLFSRSDIIRTQRELAQLGYFDPEQFGINPIQNDRDGTVDLEYTLVEKPSDQIELSGGWGAGRILGTLGVSFTNFSIKNVFKKNAWQPLPKGDGQRLSIRAQSQGPTFQAYNMSFTEPWLGGKKPNSFSVSLSKQISSNGVSRKQEREGFTRQVLDITGGSLGLGKRLQWPDDYFQLYQSISYQFYNIKNYGNVFIFSNGIANNLSYNASLSRNSIFDPLYPKYGTNITLSTKITPPFSAFSPNKDYENSTPQEKYRWTEYHKWKFTVEWYTELANKLVLMTRTGFGYLGNYNKQIGDAPFERFYLGGSALTGFQLDGREVIGLRGYDDLSLSPQTGATFITKYTTELRYPISLNPSATIYALSFLEAGNTYTKFKDYNPYNVYKSAGVGLRVFLPMFGLLGLDYGWRFDDVPGVPNMARGQFHFTIGMNLGEL